jgi:hypothetical protein
VISATAAEKATASGADQPAGEDAPLLADIRRDTAQLITPARAMNCENRRCEVARLIHVGNLPDSVDGHALRRLFEVHGVVRRATIHRHYETGRSTGAGDIEMESKRNGAAAVAALNHREHLGRVLSVCWSAGASTADRRQMFGPTNLTSEEAMGKGTQ